MQFQNFSVSIGKTFGASSQFFSYNDEFVAVVGARAVKVIDCKVGEVVRDLSLPEGSWPQELYEDSPRSGIDE